MPLSALPPPHRAHGGGQGWGGQGAEFHHMLFRYQVREAGWAVQVGAAWGRGSTCQEGVGDCPGTRTYPRDTAETPLQ